MNYDGQNILILSIKDRADEWSKIGSAVTKYSDQLIELADTMNSYAEEWQSLRATQRSGQKLQLQSEEWRNLGEHMRVEADRWSTLGEHMSQQVTEWSFVQATEWALDDTEKETQVALWEALADNMEQVWAVDDDVQAQRIHVIDQIMERVSDIHPSNVKRMLSDCVSDSSNPNLPEIKS